MRPKASTSASLKVFPGFEAIALGKGTFGRQPMFLPSWTVTARPSPPLQPCLTGGRPEVCRVEAVCLSALRL